MAIKIGLISDTHLKAPDPFLRKVVKDVFAGADLIIHAGDILRMDVLEAFSGHKLVAVAGNQDGSEVRKHLPWKEVLEIEGFRIGLIHGWGLPFGLEKRVAACFDNIDCLVYGHSHWPRIRRNRDGVLCVNPGSFSSDLISLWRRSVGMLTLDREIRAEIIRL